MATDVLAVRKTMLCKEVARLLAERDLTSVPVVSGGGRVLGMVSEADLLRREERAFSRLGAGLPRRTHHEREQAQARTVATLMTSPAITIHPEAPLGAAARLMNAHHIRRLPVVNPAGELIGIVSRRDLISVFLRPDADIADEIASALTTLVQTGPARIDVRVHDGEVALSGEVSRVAFVAEAVKIASAVDGVVDVTTNLKVSQALQDASR